MFRNLVDQPFALVIIVLAIVLLFGYKRLPDAARSIGRSMRIFKSEVKTMKDEGADDKKSASSDGRSRDAEPLEGRVVADDRPTTSPVDDHRADDHRADEHRAADHRADDLDAGRRTADPARHDA